ncbi:Spo0E family sporulation regulatory protein-aspartic acid phosphatase [Caloramator proteoclasticus]|uniref:Spo0E like sporulation regulatory protein n=1 Tax=Caloramator proteoclasticus DSM 10124 TaxID=1121262 RepID=A0A1M4U3J7_9CLOT|nr:Spo0E family sporulation regulatory protein-aspartic acid phosphatase [Caloramator proteoclasticus]SHE51302.1 Spo0E like sporulation regulatory protein [Caloramator proteoclasticus DSM 10124]
MLKDEIRNKIELLSNELNLKLKDGIKKEEYSKILKLSQELDRLIVIYTKKTFSA